MKAVPLILVGLFLSATAALAADNPERPFMVAMTGGVRLFDEDLGLKEDLSIGGRIGLGMSRRWSVLLDFVASHPIRTVTQRMTAVDALRALARCNILLGKVRPYAIAGIGGILFDFGDAPSSGRGAITLGGGLDVRIAKRAFAFAEGSADGYQSETVFYDSALRPHLAGPRETAILGTISLGIAAEF